MKYKIYFSRKPTTHIASAKMLNDASLTHPGDKIPENVAVEFGELGSWTDLVKKLQSDNRVKITSRNGFTISVIFNLGKNGELNEQRNQENERPMEREKTRRRSCLDWNG